MTPDKCVEVRKVLKQITDDTDPAHEARTPRKQQARRYGNYKGFGPAPEVEPEPPQAQP
jgi:hypothetical protein